MSEVIKRVECYKFSILNEVANALQYNGEHWSNEFCISQLKEVFNNFITNITIDIHSLSAHELRQLGCVKWDTSLFLIPIYLWQCIPDGTDLYCIDDTWHIKGKNTEERPETRYGMTAYGVNAVDYE